MKIKYVLLVGILFLTSCSNNGVRKDFGINVNDISINYKNEKITSLSKIENLDNMQDLSDFMDYVVFTSKNDEIIYTSVTDSFKNKLKEDMDYYFKWAGQYGILAHNFIKWYDDTKIDENLIFGTRAFVFYPLSLAAPKILRLNKIANKFAFVSGLFVSLRLKPKYANKP